MQEHDDVCGPVALCGSTVVSHFAFEYVTLQVLLAGDWTCWQHSGLARGAREKECTLGFLRGCSKWA